MENNEELVYSDDGKTVIGVKNKDVQSIVIPEGVTTINVYVFADCMSLTSVTLPETVTAIYDGAFFNCIELSSLIFKGTVRQWKDVHKYRSWNKWTKLSRVKCADGEITLEPYTIEDGVLSECHFPITELYVPDGVTEIGWEAFLGCGTLASVTIPEGVTTIKFGTFAYCRQLETVNLPSTLKVIGDGDYSSGGGAFTNCPSLVSITLPASVNVINRLAFANCTNLETLEFKGTVKQWEIIEKHDTWRKWTKLSCVKCSDGIVPLEPFTIKNGVFRNCNLICSELTVPDGVTEIAEMAFADCWSITSVVLPNSVKKICDDAFRNCSSLASLVIHDGVEKIGDRAFLGCASLKSLSIPDSVQTLGRLAFVDCISLVSIRIPKDEHTIGTSMFAGCRSLESVILPDNLGGIHNCAFNGCTSLKSLTLPSTLILFEGNVFQDCTSLKEIHYTGTISQWNAVEGKKCLLEAPSPISVRCADGVWNPPSLLIEDNAVIIGPDEKIVTIPDGVKRIKFETFKDHTSLVSVNIPDSVTAISTSAFQGCTSLTSVTFPVNLSEMGYSVFAYCTSLVDVRIQGNVNYIDCDMFKECTSLTSMTIPNSIKEICNNAFQGCTSLVTVTLPESLERIYDGAFQDCSSLSEINYTGTMVQWNAVHGKYNLLKYVPATVVNCTDGIWHLHSVLVENDVAITGIKENNDKAISIPDGVKKINSFAFKDFSSLISVSIPDSVTEIGEYAFQNCTSLPSITIPSSVEKIAPGAFKGCVSLRSVAFGKDNNVDCSCKTQSSQEIDGPQAGEQSQPSKDEGCKFLSSQEIDSLLANIYNGTDHADCVVQSLCEISDSLFEGCTSLESINIPENISEICSHAFSGCSSLKTVTIPYNVSKIGSDAFSGCTSLAKIYYTGTRKQFDAVAGKENLCCALPSKKISCSDGETSFNPYTVERGGFRMNSYDETRVDGWPFTEECYVFRMNLHGYKEFVSKCNVSNIHTQQSEDNKPLKSVTIPAYVTDIGENAFAECECLSEICYEDTIRKWDSVQGKRNIPQALLLNGVKCSDGVWTAPEVLVEDGIAMMSFCEKEIVIPDGVTGIAEKAFEGKKSLVSVTIPPSVRTIRARAFAGCTSLKDIQIPESVKEIEGETFEDCTSLSSIKLPSRIDYIGSNLFSNCKSLAAIVIPKSVGEIWNYAFSNCTSLVSVDIPDGVVRLRWGVFNNCTSLVSVHIPESVTEISEQAFQHCVSLSSINIPDGVVKIAHYAFTNCKSLKSVEIPAATKEIGKWAFMGCSSLASVDFNKGGRKNSCAITPDYIKAVLEGERDSYITILSSAFSDCSSLASVNFPNRITIICPQAFENCGSLSTLDIPDSVAGIGEKAFRCCVALTSVRIPDRIISFTSSLLSHPIVGDDYTGDGVVRELSWLTFDMKGLYKEMGTNDSDDDGMNDTAKEVDSIFEGCSSLVSMDIHSRKKES